MPEIMTKPDPAWLNIDAFNLPEDAIATVRAVNEELLPLVRQIADLLRKAEVADNAIEAATYSEDHGDDVSAVLFTYTGRRELWDLLGIMQSMGEEITGSSGFVEPHLSHVRAEYGFAQREVAADA